MNSINLNNFYEFINFNKLDEAEKEIKQLLFSNSDNYFLINQYANLLFLKGDLLNAIEEFKKSIKINSEYYQNYHDISLCFIQLKKFDEVIFSLKKYIEHNSNNCDVYNNLGLAFFEQDRLDDAIICFNKCIILKVDYIQAYNNLGVVLLRKGKIDDAVSVLQQGVIIDCKFNNLYFNLARCFNEKGQYLKSIKLLEDNLLNNSNNLEYLYFLASCLLKVGQISKAFYFLDECLKIKNDDIRIFRLKALNYLYEDNFNFNNYLNNTKQIRGIYGKILKKRDNIKFPKFKNKIKLGLISADLRKHAVSYQIFDVLKTLSENKDYEIFIYNNNDKTDEVTTAYKIFLNNWRDVRNLKDDELVDLIKNDNIEILLDLSGFSSGNRMPIFFCRAAPIQVAWCGYLITTGMREIDYIIADTVAVPFGDEKKFSEKVYRLKTWSVLKPINNVYVNPKIPVLEKKYISYASFNNILKINSRVIKLWSSILSNVKNSRLYLYHTDNFKDQEFSLYFKKLFTKFGAKEEQLFFLNYSDREDFLTKYNFIDITLDTFPYNGMTTSLESYWMCVPVLTLKGNYFFSKIGESINQNLGLDNFIADNENEYLKKAINFSNDLNTLQNVKDYLIKNRDKFVIFNSKNLAEELSEAFKKMIKDYKNA